MLFSPMLTRVVQETVIALAAQAVNSVVESQDIQVVLDKAKINSCSCGECKTERAKQQL